jgi:hypothetical protein
MGRDLKDQLAAALGVEPKPESKFQKIYDMFKQYLSGRVIKSPLPEEVHLLDENFPYLIKLQCLNPANNTWQDASPAIVLPLFEARIFEDSGYRLEDPRREKWLPNLPNLLRSPEFIYENHRHERSGNGQNGIRGRYIYAQHQQGQIKVAFTLHDPRLNKVIVVSSFKVTPAWLARCTNNAAPIYTKTKTAH